jgi:hypothetical protein
MNLKISQHRINITSSFPLIAIKTTRVLNYKTRVVFKIFSNTNILSEILINSEIIRGASQSRLPRLIRVEASNTAGRVHQLQAFFLFLRGRHYTFVYLAA